MTVSKSVLKMLKDLRQIGYSPAETGLKPPVLLSKT